MMRRILFCLFLLASMAVNAKDIRKVAVTPSTAKIYVDGNYVGDGIVEVTMRRSDDFIVLKFEEPGYVTLETKLFSSDKRKAVSYILRRDALYDVTVESGLSNKYFTVQVSKDLYSVDENGKKDSEKAWKLIHNVLTNYFDEIQTTDIASGYVQTPWKYETFPDIQKVVRTRVTVRETNVGGDLTFQIKISSEMANMLGMHSEESFHEINRVVKQVEPIIEEFQTRLGILK